MTFAPATENYAPAPKFRFSIGEKEDNFAQLVATGLTPTQAYVESRLAGQNPFQPSSALPAPKQSPTHVYHAAARLYASEAIQERIEYYQVLHRQSMAVTIERLQQELVAQAFFDPATLFNEDGTPITNLHNVPRYARAALHSWEFNDKGEFKWKAKDSAKAQKMLGDILGVFNEAYEAQRSEINISLGDGRGTPQSSREGVPRQFNEAIDITPEPEEDLLA